MVPRNRRDNSGMWRENACHQKASAVTYSTTTGRHFKTETHSTLEVLRGAIVNRTKYC